ncbi:MFS general substrate transporter [Dendrothele bispora CBS 962.96]|uniref:MFS general substrate transporter n=1 Tax=Dendrothele bispora (strain CBS 962.96) TaxID=1314807 RepID=A0A4S8MWF4_DENBC|nr:MFS general substrate transporter [Dendrothele bispora CBS 962.96]
MSETLQHDPIRSIGKEKDSSSIIGNEPSSDINDPNTLYHPEVDTSHVDGKKLMRRIDIHVIPWLAILYFLNFLDRGSIGNAKLYNMTKDCHITDNQYLIALTVYFFPYALLEPASNVILRRLKPSVWLSSMMLAWGVVMMCHGFIHNYGGLLAVRVLLGVTEAGMYPGIVFYISSWYKREEMGSKIAYFFSSATIAGAFSGLLAAAIHNMNGVGDLAGWRWIFIIEGLLTIVIALFSYWVIQDFPESAKFISEEERVFIIRRLQEDMRLSAAGENYKKKYIWQSLADWKTWVAMGIYMGFDGPLYAFSLFLPTIINQLGFAATKANLLSVPPYAWGCVTTVLIGLLGDRMKNRRAYVSLGLFGTGLIGYIILICSRTPGLSYFAVFLGASAIYPSIPNNVAWVAGNVEGAYKRSVTLGMAIGFGNINGAVTANIYRSSDSPWFVMGHAIVLAYIAIGFFCVALFRILLQRENARRDRGEQDEVIDGLENPRADIKNGHYPSVEAARIDKGDEWSGFRYSL